MPTHGRLDYDMVGLGDALSRAEYRVPVYQRSYAWEESEIADYWSDLLDALNDGQPDYFLGTLVLTPDPDTQRLTVIDGQQRLATTSLLYAALRDEWHDRNDEKQATATSNRYLSSWDRKSRTEEPRLILNAEDDEFFRALVINRDSPRRVAPSHERLEAAYQALRDNLKQDAASHGRRSEDRLLAWADFLDKQATVITVTVPSEADAFVIFETLNDRGAALTVGDLLKNYLFMLAGSRIETVKMHWVQALADLDVTAENELFVTFLRHHWSSLHGAVRERDLYSSIKGQITNQTQALRHAKELAEAARLYAALRSSTDDFWTARGFTTSTKDNVAVLQRLELEQNRPLLLAVLAHFSHREIRRTLQALVSWSIRGIVVGGIGGGRTERAYCDAAIKVRGGQVKTANELLAELSGIVPDDATFEDSFARARQTKKPIARYIQLALQRTMNGDSEPELVPNANEDEVNLEHVLPQRARPQDWPGFAPEELGAWTHRLGNHCLLRKSENGLIGNKPWSAKQPVLAASGLVLTRQAAQPERWDKRAIERRQNRLSKLAVRTWPRNPS